MTDVRVRSQVEAQKILARLDAQLRDWTPFWRRLEVILRDHEMGVWDSGFGLGLHASKETVEARAKRRGYYGKNQPNSRAQPSRPYREWTGGLREAVSEFTRTGRLSADVDPDSNYRGPIEAANPVSTVLFTELSENAVWRTDILDRKLDSAIEEWLTHEVIPEVVRGSAAA